MHSLGGLHGIVVICTWALQPRRGVPDEKNHVAPEVWLSERQPPRNEWAYSIATGDVDPIPKTSNVLIHFGFLMPSTLCRASQPRRFGQFDGAESYSGTGARGSQREPQGGLAFVRWGVPAQPHPIAWLGGRMSARSCLEPRSLASSAPIRIGPPGRPCLQ
jgi:hypothetical protein